MPNTTDAHEPQEAAQATPCPRWCTITPHQPGEHAGEVLVVNEAAGTPRPLEVFAQLRQDPGTGPLVILSHEDGPNEHAITPADARTLARHLDLLANIAEAE